MGDTMKFTELTEQEFQNFVDTQNNKNFFINSYRGQSYRTNPTKILR